MRRRVGQTGLGILCFGVVWLAVVPIFIPFRLRQFFFIHLDRTRPAAEVEVKKNEHTRNTTTDNHPIHYYVSRNAPSMRRWAKWHFRKNRVKCKNVISVGQILIPTNELSAIGFFWLDTEMRDKWAKWAEMSANEPSDRKIEPSDYGSKFFLLTWPIAKLVRSKVTWLLAVE